MEPVIRRRVGALAVAVAIVSVVPAVSNSLNAEVSLPGCGPLGVTGGEWRSYGHDLANSRTQPREKTIAPGSVMKLAMAWEHRATGATYNNTPIIADGCMYLAASDGTVTAHNADTGAVLWTRKLPIESPAFGGGIVGTPAVDDERLYVIVNDEGKPYLRALDRADGSDAWNAVLDTQPLAMSNSSPVLYDGAVFAGFSGHAGPGHDERGGFVLLDAATGTVLKKTFVIPDDRFAQGYAGAGVWSTPAVDTATGFAYVGTSNPHSPQLEDPRANSVLKIDLRGRPTVSSPTTTTTAPPPPTTTTAPAKAKKPKKNETSSTTTPTTTPPTTTPPPTANPAYGEIVASFKGKPDTYVPGLADQPVCETNPDVYYLDRFSATCLAVDLDFGASPTLYEAGGRKMVGALQKSGVFYGIDRASMGQVWETAIGVPCLACNAASPASAGGDLFTAAGPPGQVFDLAGGDGLPKWAGIVHGITTYNPVTVANGLVYTVDGGGFLNVWSAANGLQLVKRNIGLDTGRFMGSASTSSGIAVARNTVYAAVTDSVVAYRLGGSGTPGVPGLPPVPSVGGDGQIVAGPGAVVTTYATPVVNVPQGGSATFTNLDVAQHDVISDQGLFSTPLISLGESAPVAGVEALTPGSYGFYCSLHRNMTGTLVVS